MKMSSGLIFLIIVICLLLVLGVTNPSSHKHQAKISAQCQDLNPIVGGLGGCDLFAKWGLEYHDYILFSITKVSGVGGEKVSWGLMGMVFVVKVGYDEKKLGELNYRDQALKGIQIFRDEKGTAKEVENELSKEQDVTYETDSTHQVRANDESDKDSEIDNDLQVEPDFDVDI